MDLSNEKINEGLPDVIVLCGGKGTRLSSVVSDKPKPLAEIEGRAFLDILLQNIFEQGATRVILAVGHMKEKIMERYANDARISFSTEDAPLGTGGALLKAMELVTTEHCIAMNGDAYCDADIKSLYREHITRNALASFALAQMDDISEYGSVRIDEYGKILAFEEKLPEKRAGLVNAGIYAFDKKIKNFVPEQNNFSLERDVFPMILNQICYGHVIQGEVLDIGTPERYATAKEKLSNKHGLS